MSQTLIVRLPNWLGDTIMAVPALRGLRRGFPDTRIVAVGTWSEVLRDQALVDALMWYPGSLPARIRIADRIRDLHPDTAVLLPNSLESALAARYWGARRRIGFVTEGRGWLLTDPVPFPSPRRHQVDEYLSIVEALGVSPEERAPRLEPPPSDAEERLKARELLAAVGALTDARPLIGIHLGAAYGSAKVWPADRVIEICAEIRRAGGTPLLLGAPTDTAIATIVEAAARAPSLVGRDSRELVPAVLTEIDLLVSGDTGVSHLAAALGTPVVVLFGPTDPGISGPRGRTVVLRHAVPCAPCLYRACPIDHACMHAIQPVDVMERARQLLGQDALR